MEEDGGWERFANNVLTGWKERRHMANPEKLLFKPPLIKKQPRIDKSRRNAQ
jgi:hypothetical protein